MRAVHNDEKLDGGCVQRFRIDGAYLGRNESERLARSHWSRANEVKRDETETAMWCAKEAGLRPVTYPVDVLVEFSEQVKFYKNGNRKKPRDADNVQGAIKSIVDGLVKAGIVKDDGPDYVKRVIPIVRYVREDPHITVVVAKYKPRRTLTYLPVVVPESECD